MQLSFFLAAAGGGIGQQAKDVAEQFGLNWPGFIAQVISFCIVAFLLQRFAYRPILRTLAERRQRIADGLADAERIKQELARTEAARREVLEKAGVEATRLIEEARAAAARVQEQETQRAIATAEQIIAKAREAAEADHARMLTELKREVARLVVRTTAQVSGKVLTNEDQRRLVDETTKQLAA
jgi:F-type H+-transporting ATPase subunit b